MSLYFCVCVGGGGVTVFVECGLRRWVIYTHVRACEYMRGIYIHVHIYIYIYIYIRDGSRFSNIRLVDLIIEYRLGCAIIF